MRPKVAASLFDTILAHIDFIKCLLSGGRGSCIVLVRYAFKTLICLKRIELSVFFNQLLIL